MSALAPGADVLFDVDGSAAGGAIRHLLLRAGMVWHVDGADSRRRRHSLLEALRGNLNELIHADVNLSPDPQDDPGLDELDEVVDEEQPPAGSSIGLNLKPGSLTISPERYQIEVNGHPVHLTPTEFELLLYLAAHRERVVSCQELAREVRGNLLDEKSARDKIRPHISNMRRKLRQHDQDVQLVENVRGVGYRLSGGAP